MIVLGSLFQVISRNVWLRRKPRTGIALFQPSVPHYRTALFNGISEREHSGLTVFSTRPAAESWLIDGTRDLVAPLVTSRTYKIGPFWVVPRALRECASGRWSTIVLSWNVRQLELLPALLLARMSRTPVVLWGHGLGQSHSAFVRAVRRIEAHLANVVLTYSKAGFDAITDLAPNARVLVLENTTGRPAPTALDELAKAQYRVAFLGRLLKIKRPELLLRGSRAFFDPEGVHWSWK